MLNKKIKRIGILIIGIIVLYLAVITMLLYKDSTSRGNNIKDESVPSILDDKTSLSLNDTFIYILANNKQKYERLLPSDLLCLKISDLALIENNINESNSSYNLDSKINNSYEDLKTLYYFTENELIDLSSKEVYVLFDKYKNGLLKNEDLGSREDVVKNKILEYSFNEYIAFDIPYKEKISDSIEIGFEDFNDLNDDNEYKIIQNSYKTGIDMNIMIFKQNKIDYKIELITSNAKLIDINDESATVCVPKKDSDALKEILDKENVLISQNDISTKEELIIE